MSMNINVFKHNVRDIACDYLMPALFLIIISAVVITALWQTEASGRAEGRRLLEDGIKNAVVRHYAVEGRYPADIAIIEERYGVYIDRSRYAVFYEVFAPNIMPAVKVVTLQ